MQPTSQNFDLVRIRQQDLLDDANRHRRVVRRRQGERQSLRRR